MKIEKYKKGSNGRYIVYFSNDSKLLLYEEVILAFNLLLKKEISNSELLEISNLNMEYEVYYSALRIIKARMKSVYDLKTSLLNKGYLQECVDKVIDKLIKQGYLDDRVYAKSYIHFQMMTTSYGPSRIKRELEKKKISSNIIDEEIVVFEQQEQIEKIKKIISKEIKSNSNKGGFVLKRKIVNDLINKGYSIELINNVINEFDFKCDLGIAKKEYEKLLRKYSSKYSGNELEMIIRNKMYQKGLIYEEE